MFYFSLTHDSIARQVAGLINDNNKLSAKRLTADILNGRTNYILETHGKWVLGAVGTDRQSYTFTEIKHLVVHPQWRGKGIGLHLARRALNMSNTRMAYCTVRENNEASLALFESLGFHRAGKYPTEDHDVLLLARVTPQWEKVKPELKSNWLRTIPTDST